MDRRVASEANNLKKKGKLICKNLIVVKLLLFNKKQYKMIIPYRILH